MPRCLTRRRFRYARQLIRQMAGPRLGPEPSISMSIVHTRLVGWTFTSHLLSPSLSQFLKQRSANTKISTPPTRIWPPCCALSKSHHCICPLEINKHPYNPKTTVPRMRNTQIHLGVLVFIANYNRQLRAPITPRSHLHIVPYSIRIRSSANRKAFSCEVVYPQPRFSVNRVVNAKPDVPYDMTFVSRQWGGQAFRRRTSPPEAGERA